MAERVRVREISNEEGNATVTFTSADRVRDVLHNFNSAGFDSLRPCSIARPRDGVGGSSSRSTSGANTASTSEA